ncbi:hypothetical protein AB0442_17045 [Kitasatospora sp. NPDC085895]|uniref:hypothetical protein n=1 Tax=Kitasatospora sp. NPDC085895 TaxID=3155057 RepID=UPI00344F5A6A
MICAAAVRRLPRAVPDSWWGRAYLAVAAVAQVLTAPASLVLLFAWPLFAVLPGTVSATALALLRLGGAPASVAVFTFLARRARRPWIDHPSAFEDPS